MAISEKNKADNMANECIIKSIGVCAAIAPTQKKAVPCVFVAYTMKDIGADIRYTAMKLPAKKLYTAQDFLSAIAQAEGVKNVTYVDFDGRVKDIYVCRPNDGRIYDIVERDVSNNRFPDGFAEVNASHLKFSVQSSEVKLGAPLTFDVSIGSSVGYDVGGYEYAIVNAFNACLLGRVFAKDEFQLETKSRKRIKYEVRSVPSKIIEQEVVYIKPVCSEADGLVSHYLTEEINVIDGDEISHRIYKIAYSNRLNDYNLTKQ